MLPRGVTLGSLAWAARRGGNLTFRDKLRVIGSGIAATLRGRRGIAFTPSEAQIDEIVTAPTGELARFAEATCAACSPPWLVQHCLRSYAWAALLAARDGARLDRELIWVAALLHDLGLTELHHAPDGTCFAYHGALVTERMLSERGVDPERTARVAEAICQHLDLAPSSAPEARYLQAATAFDTAGVRFHDLDASVITDVHARHPRLDMRTQLPVVIKAAARSAPDSRIALLCRLGFLRRVASAPFA